MANSVDPDETARFDPSHLDLHCLHSYCRAGISLLLRNAFNPAAKKNSPRNPIADFSVTAKMPPIIPPKD